MFTEKNFLLFIFINTQVATTKDICAYSDRNLQNFNELFPNDCNSLHIDIYLFSLLLGNTLIKFAKLGAFYIRKLIKFGTNTVTYETHRQCSAVHWLKNKGLGKITCEITFSEGMVRYLKSAALWREHPNGKGRRATMTPRWVATICVRTICFPRRGCRVGRGGGRWKLTRRRKCWLSAWQ